MFSATYDEEWPNYFNKFSNEMKERIVKKISKILEYPQKRHLQKGAKFFVGEIGQNRIVYRIFEHDKTVKFYFIGDHKEYEKWYKKFF